VETRHSMWLGHSNALVATTMSACHICLENAIPKLKVILMGSLEALKALF